MQSDSQTLRALITASKPFLRITKAVPERWCRVMKNEKDGRIGPWDYVATFEVLCAATWSRQGEVIYFVTDASDTLRLVGQSMSKLKGRWKEVPMYHANTKFALNRKALFHTSSWPAIESGLKSPDQPPFTVSALFRPELERLCRTADSSLIQCLSKPETNHRRLSYYVETWICELDHRPKPLWNKDKVPFVYSGLTHPSSGTLDLP